MKKYIDFDDVIVNTRNLLFIEYNKLKEQGLKINIIKYMQNYNWYDLLNRCEVIGDSIEFLKSMKEAIILTKVHSMDNEGVAKIKYLREQGIKNDIILSSHLVKKTDMVDPVGNILVDDNMENLNDWAKNGGFPIFFNNKDLDFDNWGRYNNRYIKIRTLEELRNIK